MKPEDQRIAIATLDRWSLITSILYRGEMLLCGKHPEMNEAQANFPDGDGNWLASIPDYLNDLNAIHEAEKTIWKHEKEYIRQLIERLQTPEDAIFATATQRAEAFLRTLGKWVE